VGGQTPREERRLWSKGRENYESEEKRGTSANLYGTRVCVIERKDVSFQAGRGRKTSRQNFREKGGKRWSEIGPYETQRIVCTGGGGEENIKEKKEAFKKEGSG